MSQQLDRLKSRCRIDTRPPFCWNWQGARAVDGTPRLWAFEPSAGCKRSVSGPRAAWCIAFDEPPMPGYLVFRACGNRLCLNPSHLRCARDKAELGRHVALAGWRKGMHLEARAASAALGRMAQGIIDTPDDIVRAIRAAPVVVRDAELARRYGLSQTGISRIRNFETRKGVTP